MRASRSRDLRTMQDPRAQEHMHSRYGLGVPTQDFLFPTSLEASTACSPRSIHSPASPARSESSHNRDNVINVNVNVAQPPTTPGRHLPAPRSIVDVDQSPEEHEYHVQGVFRELTRIKESLTLEVQASKRECLAKMDDVQRLLERQDEGLRSLLGTCDKGIQFLVKHRSDLELAAGVAGQVVDMNGKSNRPLTSKSHSGNISDAQAKDERVSQQGSPEQPIGEPASAAMEKANSLWADFQEAVVTVDIEDQHALTRRVMTRTMESKSVWHHLFEYYGAGHYLHTEPPKGELPSIVRGGCFLFFQNLLIASNACLMGYEMDLQVKAALQEPMGEIPEWLMKVNLGYNIAFCAELSLRMLAMRTWFWVSPHDWGWNAFDVIVVASSLATEMLEGVQLNFLRTFRILRAVRAVRIIRMLRFFRELRKILFAILASLGSLLWCFAFLAMTMFMFSILILQGLVQCLQDMESSHSSSAVEERRLVQKWFGSMPSSMFSLLAAVTGGDDWLSIREPLIPAGVLYTTAFVVYVLFVLVGVMNVLTGVFLSSADEYSDRALIVQNEQVRVDSFVEQMVEVFKEWDPDGDGRVDWAKFKEAMQAEDVQAYLSAHGLNPTQARLIFDILDEKDVGELSILDLVVGLLRLKGEARVIDARIIQRELGMIPKLMNHAFKVGHAAHSGTGKMVAVHAADSDKHEAEL